MFRECCERCQSKIKTHLFSFGADALAQIYTDQFFSLHSEHFYCVETGSLIPCKKKHFRGSTGSGLFRDQKLQKICIGGKGRLMEAHLEMKSPENHPIIEPYQITASWRGTLSPWKI